MRFTLGIRMMGAALLAVAGVGSAQAATIVSPNILSGVDALKEWNLIVFNDMTGGKDVEGRSFIGGNVSGNATPWDIKGAAGVSTNGYAALTVVGNLNSGGSTKYGGGVVVGGNVTGDRIDRNDNTALRVGGTSTQQNGTVITGLASSQANFTSNLTQQKSAVINSLGSLSTNLRALSNTGTVSNVPNQMTINGTGSFNVFSIAGSDLAASQSLTVTSPNGTTVVNVSGKNISFGKNFTSTDSEIGRNVIWNFYEAETLSFTTEFFGTVLAPKATVSNGNAINGTLVANNFNQGGEVHLDGFQGDLSSVGGSVSAMPEPATWAMLILGFGLVGGVMRRQRGMVLVRA